MKNRIRIVNNSPAVLGFTALCVLTFIINVATGGISNNLLFLFANRPPNMHRQCLICYVRQQV